MVIANSFSLILEKMLIPLTIVVLVPMFFMVFRIIFNSSYDVSGYETLKVESVCDYCGVSGSLDKNGVCKCCLGINK